MKLILFVVVCGVAVASAFPRTEGVTNCRPGPFKMGTLNCNCASDSKHYICDEPQTVPAREVGVVESCVPGRPVSRGAQRCECASDGRHYVC